MKTIKLTFGKEVNGYWDGGLKTGGTFEPTFRYEDDPKRSFVKWGSFELNFWFNQPLHNSKGVKYTEQQVLRRAKDYIKKTTRVQHYVEVI